MKPLSIAAALLLTLGLAGCGASGDVVEPPIDVDAGESAPPSEGSSDAQACGGLTTADLNGIFGVELTGPEPELGSSDQNGVSWTNTGCDWEHDPSDLELDLELSGPSDFTDDTVACIEPGGVGDVSAVSGIGTQAWWSFYDFDEVEGELRVCTDDSLVSFSIDAESGSFTSDDLRERAIDAVRVIVG